MTAVTVFTPSLRTRKKAATREAIFKSAVRLFSERGFDRPTIDDIAAAAGTGKGTFYNYFSSKEDILVAYMVEIEGRVQKRTAKFAEAEGPLDRILCDVLRYYFRLKRPYLVFNRILLSQIIQRAAELQEPIARMQEVIDPSLINLFRRLQQRKLIHSSVDIAHAVHRFKVIHFGISCLWSMEGPPFRESTRAIDEHARDFARRLQRR
jgi:AcrR family transcriptional regulator